MKKIIGALLALGLTAGSASAASVIGATISVAQTGNVTATFEARGGSYVSELYLGSQFIFDNTVATGTSVSLGNFVAGQVLKFYIHVTNTGDTFYSGAGGDNADGLPHATVETLAGKTIVGFEDIFGGGDRDYDDIVYSFTNTAGIPTVPVPAAGFLLIAGLGALGALKRRR